MSSEMSQKLVEIENDSINLATEMRGFSIENAEQMRVASEKLAIAKSRVKRVEELRKFFTQPLNDQVKKINDEFRKVREPYEILITDLSKKMVDFRAIEAKRIEDERKKAEKEAKKKAEELKKENPEAEPMDLDFSADDFKQSNKINTSEGQASFRKTWDFEITDEKKIPKKYLKVDEVAIRKAIREGKRKIAGVKIFQKEIIVNR